MAKFILEGRVLKKLSKYKDNLLSLPIVMVKPWGNLHGERTHVLLQQLIQSDIDSRQKLLDAMTKNIDFLLDSYLKWVPDSLRTEIKDLWPSLCDR